MVLPFRFPFLEGCRSLKGIMFAKKQMTMAIKDRLLSNKCHMIIEVIEL